MSKGDASFTALEDDLLLCTGQDVFTSRSAVKGGLALSLSI